MFKTFIPEYGLKSASFVLDNDTELIIKLNECPEI